MIEIDLRFDPPFRDLLIETVETAGGSPDPAIVECAARISDDADMRACWADDLVSGLRGDGALLLDLLRRAEFGNGTVALDEDEASALVRALSAVRLKVRGTELKSLDDAALEEGEVDPDRLTYEQRRGFAAYVFFAAVQESVIRQLAGR